jgi:acetolactate synthase I/II/III large subunit
VSPRTLLANEVDLCLMNPGTSEMQFVAALDRVPEMRGVLGLFEGVCSGAADGYARMTGKPAATLLHLGPGLANALSNLHNARKALSPVVNIVGEHSTAHLKHDAPLTADIEAFARPVSGWVRTVESASAMGEAARPPWPRLSDRPDEWRPHRARRFFLERGRRARPSRAAPAKPLPDGEQLRAAASALRSGQKVGLLLGGGAPGSRFGRRRAPARRHRRQNLRPSLRGANHARRRHSRHRAHSLFPRERRRRCWPDSSG